jgi:D-glycero-alpha-D-manno-heptose-7-phosphate kinase
MIISRTPFRLSFFGGGTDYPSWYRVHGGAVLAASIDKYCYLTCRYLPPFFDHRIRLVYRQIETCKTIEEIAHPVVRAALRHLDFQRGLELHHDGDLPARSGMGSSSAFAVGLLHALHALMGRLRSKMQLAQESIHIEQEIMGETVGSQDQVMAAFGGLRYVQFHTDGKITADPLPLPAPRLAELQAHLMLFYTGIPRTASDVAQSYVSNILGRGRQLHDMRRLVEESVDLLVSGQDLDAFGSLLHDAWLLKRSLSKRVSTPRVDGYYEEARQAGALGGKLTGAGGGGFLLFFVPPVKQTVVRKALAPLLQVPFAFETAGSQILFYEPGVDYQEAEKDRQNQALAGVSRLAMQP